MCTLALTPVISGVRTHSTHITALTVRTSPPHPPAAHTGGGAGSGGLRLESPRSPCGGGVASAPRSRGPAWGGSWAPGSAEPPPGAAGRPVPRRAGLGRGREPGPRAGRALDHHSWAKAPSLPNHREGRTRPRREGGGRQLQLVAFSELKENGTGAREGAKFKGGPGRPPRAGPGRPPERSLGKGEAAGCAMSAR